MKPQQAKQRIEKLRKEINYHRYLYHVLDRQEISDAALDSLKHELWKLEQEFPRFITPDSPTQRVGGKPLEGFQKIRHALPMLSLEDVFSPEELREWVLRLQKLLPHESIDFYAEQKIDGFAVSLVYKNGLFVQGSTRGDGTTGEDVTQNLRTIESIPLRLEIHGKIDNQKMRQNIQRIIQEGEIEIRGEVYMTMKAFQEVNKEQQSKGLPLYANPRNTAAGSVRQLDPKVTASRKLTFLAYDIVGDFGQTTHEEEHKICTLLGFRTDMLARYYKDSEAVIDFWARIMKKREQLPHQIDGIVVTINTNRLFEKLGVVGKAPRGSIAFKFPGKEVTTIVEDIRVQIGRTGVLTPVAWLRAVRIGGVTVTRATLHNMDEIRRLGVKIGDTVIVQRAGDVIPDVVQVLPNLRTGKEKDFHMPKVFCGQKVVRPEGEVGHRILHPEKCEPVNRERLYHFVSKKAFDMKGLGPKIIDALMDQGLIEDGGDLFMLEEGDLIPLERFGEKSAQNLINAIAKSKIISLSKFLFALGILHIGEKTAQLLALFLSSRGTMKNPRDLVRIASHIQMDEWQTIEGIGPAVGESMYEFFHNKKNIEMLEKLAKAGVRIHIEKTRSQKLRSKTFVFTGTLETMTRDEAKEKVRSLGANVSSHVSAKTDYVVIGKEPGSKFKEAQRLGIKIINEKEFLKMLSKY